jgi:hypothetical protein
MLRQHNSLLHLSSVLFVSLLAVLAVSCNQSQPPETYYGEVARVINAKVENYTAGKASLKTYAMLSDIVTGSGQLETDGNFTFSFEKLEDIRGKIEFIPITYLACTDIIPDNQETARYLVADTIVVVGQGGMIGEIFSSPRKITYPDFQPEVNDYLVTRIGVDKDVTIKGTCTDEVVERDFALELKEGWNIVVWTITALDAKGEVTAARLETKPAPSGARWWFLEFSPVPVPPL